MAGEVGVRTDRFQSSIRIVTGVKWAGRSRRGNRLAAENQTVKKK